MKTSNSRLTEILTEKAVSDWVKVRLGYKNKCHKCGEEIPAGHEAHWFKTLRVIKYIECKCYMCYYFDIETVAERPYFSDPRAGLNPATAKIITIQYQPLDYRTGRPIGDLVILKEWCSSEKEIIRQFIKVYFRDPPWGFIPVGNNLLFENSFLKYKLRQHFGLINLKLGQRPIIDLKPVLILMNGGKFRGYSALVGNVAWLQTWRLGTGREIFHKSNDMLLMKRLVS